MPDRAFPIPDLAWPTDGLTRVPYWVFQREDVYAREQKRLFQGPHWYFLCLEAEIAEPGDFRLRRVLHQRRAKKRYYVAPATTTGRHRGNG